VSEPTPTPEFRPEPVNDRAARLPYGPPFLVADPAASRSGLGDLRRQLARAGVVAQAAVARPAGRARELAEQALERGARLLVAVGSDEIAHGLVSALIGPDGPGHPDSVLGLVGLGRQDLSATFGLPDDPERATHHLLGEQVFLADVGRATWTGPDGAARTEVFANCAELGYPAEASARLAGRDRAGRVGRLAAALGALAVTRSTPARLGLDRGAVDFRLAGLVIANGQFSMGRMKVAPRALPDDGRLSVMAFEGSPLTIYARSKDLYYGLHVPHPTVREYQSTRVEVDAAERLTLSLDGVRMPGGPPLAVEVLDKVLRVKV
jgi:diacylglycerol kinase family enzyme